MRQLSIDLIAQGDAELYVREADALNMINEYALSASQQPNVILRVPPQTSGCSTTTRRCGQSSWSTYSTPSTTARCAQPTTSPEGCEPGDPGRSYRTVGLP